MSDLTVERHDEIMDLMDDLYMYWRAHPELRLGQIIVNFAELSTADPFYMPDSYYRAAIEAQLADENKEVKDV